MAKITDFNFGAQRKDNPQTDLWEPNVQIINCERMIGPFKCCSIIQGDSTKLLKEVPSGYVSLILTDPPYGIGLDYDSYNDSEKNLKQIIAAVMPEFSRISELSLITTGIPQMFLYPKPTWVLCWYYHWTDRLTPWGVNTWQPILCYGKDPRTGKLSADSIDLVAPSERSANHPCPKPPRLWRQLINRTLPLKKNKIHRVLDPFSGSGTTARICKLLGIHFLCFEQSAKYVEESRYLLENTSDTFFQN